jgi:hypothetical protein
MRCGWCRGHRFPSVYDSLYRYDSAYREDSVEWGKAGNDVAIARNDSMALASGFPRFAAIRDTGHRHNRYSGLTAGTRLARTFGANGARGVPCGRARHRHRGGPHCILTSCFLKSAGTTNASALAPDVETEVNCDETVIKATSPGGSGTGVTAGVGCAADAGASSCFL